MSAQPARPAMFPRHPYALDVSAVNEVLEFADELDHRDVLPFHVRAVEVEADDITVARFGHEGDVVARRFDIAHGAFAGVTLEVEGDPVLSAEIPDRLEALDEQFQTYLTNIGNRKPIH